MCRLNFFALTNTAYFYTYSALAQSMAALLGVLGIFGVYRLQILQQELPQMHERIRSILLKYHSDTTFLNDEELIVFVTTPLPAGLAGLTPRLSVLAKEIKKAQEKREGIKTKFLFLALAFAFLTVWALFCTSQAEFLEKNQPIAAPLTLVTLCVTGISLWGMLWFAYDCLAEKSLSNTVREWVRARSK